MGAQTPPGRCITEGRCLSERWVPEREADSRGSPGPLADRLYRSEGFGHAPVPPPLPNGQHNDIALREHNLFVGSQYLIPVHNEPSAQLKDLKERVHKSPELTRGKPAFITCLVIDAIVDATFPVLEKLDDLVGQLEDDIIQKASPKSLGEIYDLKHTVTDLRIFLGPQRDVFQRLITHGIHLQQQDVTLYYRDVYDHIVRQYEPVDSLRDLLTSAMDVYLSTVSNRLNTTMKTLTGIASPFLPLSFLTSSFASNL